MSTLSSTGSNIIVVLRVLVCNGSDPLKNERRENRQIEERSSAQRDFESSSPAGSKNADGTKSDIEKSEANVSKLDSTAQYGGEESV